MTKFKFRRKYLNEKLIDWHKHKLSIILNVYKHACSMKAQGKLSDYN